MWTTTTQTDSWINLGDVNRPDWVRLSTIDRVRSVEGAKNAAVVLKSGKEVWQRGSRATHGPSIDECHFKAWEPQ